MPRYPATAAHAQVLSGLSGATLGAPSMALVLAIASPLRKVTLTLTLTLTLIPNLTLSLTLTLTLTLTLPLCARALRRS